MNNIFNTKIIQEDVEYIATHYDFSPLKNSSVVLTGATGLIGSHLLMLFLYLNEYYRFNIKIYALVRDIKKAESLFACQAANNIVEFVEWNAALTPIIADSVDFVIHGASATSSQFFVNNPVETIKIALDGTRNLLEFARKKSIKSFVYLSSMEVFGVTDHDLKEVRESDYGYIDILNPRSSYSESKRMCECMCVCYATEYSLPVKIARLTQVLGPGMDYNDSRVTGLFVRALIEKKNIILKTEGKTARPSVYLRDAVSGILLILLKGKVGDAYTVANAKTFMSMKNIAQMLVSEIADNSIKLQFDIDIPKEYAPNLNLNLNTQHLEELGWSCSVGLKEAYQRIIANFRGN